MKRIANAAIAGFIVMNIIATFVCWTSVYNTKVADMSIVDNPIALEVAKSMTVIAVMLAGALTWVASLIAGFTIWLLFAILGNKPSSESLDTDQDKISDTVGFHQIGAYSIGFLSAFQAAELIFGGTSDAFAIGLSPFAAAMCLAGQYICQRWQTPVLCLAAVPLLLVILEGQRRASNRLVETIVGKDV